MELLLILLACRLYTKVTGATILIMVREDLPEEISNIMMETLEMVNFKVMVQLDGQMEINTWVKWMKIEEKVKGLSISHMVISMRVIFWIINSMVLVNILGKVEIVMKVTLSKVKWQEKEIWITLLGLLVVVFGTIKIQQKCLLKLIRHLLL